jgi:hypothetical protein
LLDEEKCYLIQVFTELASRAKDNEQRKGRPSLSLSEFLDIATARHRIHAYLLPFRQLEGFLRTLSIHIKKLKEIIPDFTTIWWRIERMKINLDPKLDPERDDIVIAVDSTGIKVTNKEENGYLTNGREKEE